MEPLIISEFIPEKFVLKLQTSQRNDIENEQHVSLSRFEHAQIKSFEKRFPDAKFKGELTPIYNCHGFTFASRRTGIFPTLEIEKILREDKYFEIKAEKDVMPGDIVIYYDEDEISHSGMVVQVDLPGTKSDLISISILSKWGKYKEVIHNVNNSPYSFGGIKYWRVNHGFKII